PSAISVAPQAGGAEWMWAAAGGVVAAAIAAALLLRKRGTSGDCADLNEIDLAIIRALHERGGAADRTELQDSLSLPKTTLHRHLHKLARYGYVRLVQEGPRQRVELVKSC
ncbi:MAG: helix-turn-helix domain-containing protein, partial [Pyrobaculum sp.]